MLDAAKIAAWIAALVFLVVFGLLSAAQTSQQPSKKQKQDTENPKAEQSDSHPQTDASTQQSYSWSYYQEQAKQKWESIVSFIETRDKLVSGISTIFIAIFTVILASGTVFLWVATRSLVTDARDASQRQLRAYVYLEVWARIYPPPPEVPNRYAISLGVINKGVTWARNVRIKKIRPENPTGDPFDIAALNATETFPVLLGPGQRVDLQFGDIWLTELPDIKAHKRRLYYIAWVTYEDTLSNPPIIRQTQISMEIGADTEGIGHVSFGWNSTHNCADDDCPK